MKIGAHCVLLASILTLTSSLGREGLSRVRPVERKGLPQTGVKAGGLQLTAKLEKAVVPVDQPIWVEVILANVTRSRTISLVETDPRLDYRVDVTAKDGTALRLTDAGKSLEERRSEGHPLRRFIKELAPGEDLRERFPVDDIYEMKATGGYLITVRRTVPKVMKKGFSEVVSNTVEVRVED